MSWPYRLEDWALALELGQGFVLHSAGMVIGTAAWWAYGEAHASAGMIVVVATRPTRPMAITIMPVVNAARPIEPLRPGGVALRRGTQEVHPYRLRMLA